MSKKSEIQPKLLCMLRRRQEQQGVHYMRRDSSFYRVCKVLFLCSLAVSSVINILSFFSAYIRLKTNLNYADKLNDMQAAEVAKITSGLYAIAIMSIILILSAVFLLRYRPLPQMLATLFAVPVLLWTFGTLMSRNLDAGQYGGYALRYLLPLGCVLLFSLLCGIVAAREKHFDTVGCREISEKVYLKYSADAENITPEQWEILLNEYATADAQKHDRKTKHRRLAEANEAPSDATAQDEV